MTEKEFKIKVLPLTPLVYRLAVRMLQDDEAARDAVQLSMVKLWENRPKLDECNSIKAFVFRVVRNTCLDELKRKKPIRLENDDRQFEGIVSGNDFENKEAAELVRKLIDGLPQGQKEVILMRDVDGLEFEEIAEVMDYDIPYLRVLLSRARRTIKDKLLKVYAYEAAQQKRVN